jgi:pyrroline-5-carboxylate reductase
MAEKIEKAIGVIGAGSMGAAIARGLVASGAADPERILVANPSAGKLAPLAELGIKTFTSNEELLAQDPSTVVLAVKPQVLPGVLAEHADGLAGRLVISIAAGVSVASLEASLASSRVVRAMPNLPVQVLSGATAVCPGSRATEEDLALALAIFSALGSAVVLREDQLDAEGAVVGCGPAYMALLVDDLTRAWRGARTSRRSLPRACALYHAWRGRAALGVGRAPARLYGEGDVSRRHDCRGFARNGVGYV